MPRHGINKYLNLLSRQIDVIAFERIITNLRNQQELQR